jgi:hypothetical protein
MKGTIFLFLTFLFLLVFSCASKTSQSTAGQNIADSQIMEIPEEVFLSTDAGKILTVNVKEENVRAYPNEKIIGKLSVGDTIVVKKRVGNWVQFTNDRFSEAFIWGPSVGYPYQNLYSPGFYYNAENKQFYDVEYFQRMFSQKGQRRLDVQSYYELFFKNIGLGSHDVTIGDTGPSSQGMVEHGITLFVDKKSQKVLKVRVDYLRPVQGYAEALKKSELPVKVPGGVDRVHFSWPAGELLDHINVNLERQEWDSQWLSSIWFMLPEKE